MQRGKSNNILIIAKEHKVIPSPPGNVVEAFFNLKDVFMYLKKYNNTQDKVRICKNDLCIETQGWKSNLVVGSVAFFFICLGIAAINKGGK